MMQETMTPLQRVFTALEYEEPDRVPFFLLFTARGAIELGISIKEYFSSAKYIAEGQLRMRAKYRHDCLFNHLYAALDVEPWGGEARYFDDGSPNAGEPIIRKLDDIKRLQPPKAKDSPRLQVALELTEMLKAAAGDEVPILGVVVAPFSLPIMQMGFDSYIDLIYEQPELFDHLMRINEEFSVGWANAQLEAGATAIGYFDPMASPTFTPRELYLRTGFQVAKRTISRIKGSVGIHTGSGRALPVIGDFLQAGATLIGVSARDDLTEVKKVCDGKAGILGNLEGVDMYDWTPGQAEEKVRAAIAKGGPGGGFILADNHGDIPLQVPDPVLLAISEAVHKWGKYPLNWVREHDGQA